MKNQTKLFEQGIEEHSLAGAIWGNIIMLLWIALGTIVCSFISTIAGLIYLAYGIIMVYFVMRKLVCTNCYYYGKTCSMGWGKISALFFKKGNIENFHKGVGQKMAPLVYGLLTIVPVILGIISMIMDFSVYKVITFVLMFAVSFYSGNISRKKSCLNCKMKLACPGCAVKTNLNQVNSSNSENF